jgi:16S rRNA processing protein RimM
VSRRDRVEIGYVARAHGVRGELRVVPHDPASTALAEVDEVWVSDARYPVAGVRATRGAFLVRLIGVGDRDRAQALRGQPVSVRREHIALDDGEVLLADLVGCAVELPDGTPWGVVSAIDVGPQDRLVIVDGDVERLVPVVPELIPEIDIDGGRVVVAPPEGLPETRRR